MWGWVMSQFLEKKKANESQNWDPFVCSEDKRIAKVGKTCITLISEQGGSVGNGC